MLQDMRNNMKGTVAFIVVGFLAFILAASLANLGGSGAGNTAGEAATVDGEIVTGQELQIALAQERQRLQNRFGDNLPAEFLADERLRQPVLEGLIQRRLLLNRADDVNMTIGDAEIDRLITQIPSFQTDGRFDQQLFINSIRRIGHTPLSFRELLREDLVVNQLRNTMTGSAFVIPAEIKQSIALTRQTRDFSWVSLPLGDLPEKMTVSEEEIAAHYEDNRQNYNTEEKVSIEYLELKVSEIAKTLEVSEAEIQRRYQLELETFTGLTERQAAHIMIEGDDQAAKAKIAEVQQKLAAGEDFSALAASYSDDPGSKDNGGSLGVTSGDTFPTAFEQTLAILEAGQVSAPVEIDGATHFIKLISVTTDTPPSFEDSRERIENEIKNVEAEKIYLEKLAALRDLAYNADSLAEVAEQLSLSVGKTDLFTRAGGKEPVLSDSRVVAAAFSEQVLQQGFTSDVLELAPDTSVVINLVEHQPVRMLTLKEKKADIIAALKLKKAKARLAEQAKNLEDALAADTALEALAKENDLTVRSGAGVSRDGGSQPAEIIAHVFDLPRPAESSPVTSSLYLSDNDYALVSLTAVNDAVYDELTEEEQRGVRLSLERSRASSELDAWQTFLSNRADIEISGQ